jgi:hypothetical protein
MNPDPATRTAGGGGGAALALAAGALLGLALPAAAHAADEAASAAARAETLIRQATDLRRAGRDARAYPLLLEAYTIHTSPRTAIQLGLVEMQLGQWLQAERHLSEGMAFQRDPWVWNNRASLAQSLATVKAAIGEVVVTGAPAGAEVIVNGKQAGVLPRAGPVRVGEGPVNIEVRAASHRPEQRSINVLGGKREEVAVALQRALPPGAAPDAQAVASGQGGPATGVDGTLAAGGGGGWSSRRIASAAVGGAGVLAVGTGVALALRARARCEDAKARGSGCADPAGKARPGWIVAGAGAAAALAGGLGLWIFDGKDGKAAAEIALSPSGLVVTVGGAM